jgi:hypothetical protein
VLVEGVFVREGEGSFENGSLAIERIYNGCMGWVYVPSPPLVASSKSL